MNAVHYESHGEGRAVVLIAGLGGLGAFWKPIVPLLARHFQVLTFDHPGVGLSAPPAAQTIPTIAAAVLDVLDRESIDAAHIVGHSTGSLVAQTLGLDHPGRCHRLVLSGGWAKPDRRFRDLFAFRRYLLQRVGPSAYSALSKLGGYDGQWYDRHLAADAPPDFDAAMALDVETVSSRIDMLLAYERADELARLAQDVLVVGAEDDFIVPFYNSADLAERIARSELEKVDGGHFFPQVAPDAFATLVGSFLERT
ncbi:alpha/beta fold hydrolase [Burkholderia sp. JKS000303]|uniref:alpha/beta fold hydrolase n=1 Tax=Burkholderia sp. JKS000303 TaxID=1938747 RepID=UPI000BF7E41A|nr:alpha/beta hydrolase [Burkholderia sp. JKS000303]PFH20400.1 aminoacrylate hydrolase [Burkholderia sp. JKS000303]